jgi:xylose dehydrogenase (NAD/NADP)
MRAESRQDPSAAGARLGNLTNRRRDRMKGKLSWGILGTGNIARQFARAIPDAERGRLAAVGSRVQFSADDFAAAYNVPRAYGSYEGVLADPVVDAVYVSLPNSMHHEWTIKALRAGKHVLCEKPIASTRAQAQDMFDTARQCRLALVEAFMYRSHPLTAAWLARIRAGEIGQVRAIRSSFCFCASQPAGNIRFSSELAGGSLMDVGCYCINLSRLAAGAEPEAMTAVARLHESGVDEVAAGTMRFPGGIVAAFTCGMTVHADNAASICGSLGYIEVPIPWKPPMKDAQFVISNSVPPAMDTPPNAPVLPGSRPRHVITVNAPKPLYALEADDMAAMIFDGAPPAVSEPDSLGNMTVLDRLRRQIGVLR